MAMMNEMEYRTIGSALAGGYRAAVYCRLSKDDDLQGESASIANQRDMLEKYCEKQGCVLRPFYDDFHLFSDHRKSRVQHGNPIMQANAFPCACPVVSGQIVPAEWNLACISGCGNRHFARCTCDDGMASTQKYLITCFAKEEL